jgi:hypothetical protein
LASQASHRETLSAQGVRQAAQLLGKQKSIVALSAPVRRVTVGV